MLASVVHGQLQIENANYTDAKQFVREMLTGNGVHVYNAEFKGYREQLGVFSNGQSLGVESGIVLSTGRVEDLVNEPDHLATSILRGLPGREGQDEDLFNLSKELTDKINAARAINSEYVDSVMDAAILEFEFSPTSNKLTFEFLFFSEEYPDWINNRFSDIMGVFIQGPGYNGPYMDLGENIAFVPETDFPINVSSVNGGNDKYEPFNENYFVENTGAEFAANGYTVPIKIEVYVEPCEIYKMKIAIADGSFPDKDSGILIKGKSFDTDAVTSRILGQDEVLDPSNIYKEGCVPLAIEYTFPQIVPNATIQPIFSLDPEPGTYATTDDVVFLNNMNTAKGTDTLYIELLDDGVSEVTEFLTLDLVNQNNGCLIARNITEVYIEDKAALQWQDSKNTDTVYSACSGVVQTFVANPNLENGVVYQWSGNVSESQRNEKEVQVSSNLSEEQFTVTVTDTCNGESISKIFVLINDQSAAPLTLNLGSDSLLPCRNQFFQPVYELIGGVEPYLYTVTYRGDEVYSQATAVNVFLVSQAGEFVLKVEDQCGNSISDSIQLSLAFNDFLNINGIEDLTLCPGKSVTINPEISGGREPYQYTLNQEQIDLPHEISEAGRYSFTVIDYCDESESLNFEIDEANLFADFTWNYTGGFNIKTVNFSSGKASYIWILNGDTVSTDFEIELSFEERVDQELTLVVFTGEDCKTSLTKTVSPPILFYIPSAFSPDGDGINDCFQVKGEQPDEFSLKVFDRWGKIVFETSDFNACWNGSHPFSKTKIIGFYAFEIKAKQELQQYNLKGSFLLLN